MTETGPQHPQPDPASVSPAIPSAVERLLQDWRHMALKASGRHSAACDRYEHLDSFYGVGSTVLTAVVGSTIFVTLQKTATEWVRIVAGLVAAVAAIASGIQTAAKYGQRAERHRQASRHYASVARRIDELLADPPVAQIAPALDQLRKSLDDAGAMAPNVPPRIWRSGPTEGHRLALPSHHEALRRADLGGESPQAVAEQQRLDDQA